MTLPDLNLFHRVLNQCHLVESNNSLYSVNDDQIAHYWNAGKQLDSTLRLLMKSPTSVVVGHSSYLMEEFGLNQMSGELKTKQFVNRYFNQIFAQFNLNDLGFNFAPDIFESKELDKPAIKKKIEARTEEGILSGLIIFDLFHDESSESDLINYQVSRNQTLLQFVKDLLPLNANHLVVGVLTMIKNTILQLSAYYAPMY